jgi:hypothetical protein
MIETGCQRWRTPDPDELQRLLNHAAIHGLNGLPFHFVDAANDD